LELPYFVPELAHERSLLCYHIARQHSIEPDALCEDCKQVGLRSAGFSLRGFIFDNAKTHRLTPTLLN
jgi:hypothetical protein